MTDKTPDPCGSDSSTELGPVGWRYVPSEVWGAQVLTQDQKAAQLAREFGRDVEPLYTEAQLLARVAAERERCAGICDEMKTKPPGNEPDDVERGYNAALRRAAERIRSPNAALTGQQQQG